MSAFSINTHNGELVAIVTTDQFPWLEDCHSCNELQLIMLNGDEINFIDINGHTVATIRCADGFEARSYYDEHFANIDLG